MLGTLLRAAIPTAPDITLQDTVKVTKKPVESIDTRVQEVIGCINTNQNVTQEWSKVKKTVQKPIENIGDTNFEYGTINDVETVQKPIKFIPLEQLMPNKNIEEKWENSIKEVLELPNTAELSPSVEFGTINGINVTELGKFVPLEQLIQENSIGIEGKWKSNTESTKGLPDNVRLNPNNKYRLNIELGQLVPYENVNPSTGYGVTVNTQKSENCYSIEENAVVTTEEKVYSIERNITVTKGANGNFNVCIRGKVTIKARYVGHSFTEIPAEEEIKFIIENESPALEVNQLYVERDEEKSDWENILDIYKISLAEGQINFNSSLAFLNGTIRSIKYLLDKYLPSLGETTERWKQQKDEFFESSLEEMRKYYTEHPEAGNNFQKMLVGMEIDETELNLLEKTKLAEDAFKAGIVKDVASGVNGIIDIIFSPLETLDALTSPMAGAMIWQGLTEDVANDWQKGTVQGRSQAAGRVVSMLIPIEGVKAAGTAGKAGKTGGVLTKLKRVGSRSGTGVEISKPVKKMDIKKVEFPKTPVNYGDHYKKVNGKKSLKPDIEYVDGNNYKYTTDAQGRISKVEGELKLKKGERNTYAQRTVGGKDRLPTDDGGHLIGSQFDGSGDIDNLVPQSKYLNRSGGEWYKMEQEWADALKEGKKVEVDIQPIYKGTSTRPDSFSVRYKIDGKETVRRMTNPTGS